MKQNIGLIIGTLGVLVPALLQWLAPGAVAPSVLLGIAAVSGAVAGEGLVPRGQRVLAHAIAVASGALAAACAFALLRWWLAHRSSVYSVEALLVITIGAMPAGLLGRWAYLRAL